MQDVTIVESILRDRFPFFQEIRERVGLSHKIVSMLASSFLFLAIYGAVMGARHSALQTIASSLKVPSLFLVTLVICTPSLYFFNLLFGSQQSMAQNLALILTAMTTSSVLLLGLAPVTLFFLLTTTSYPFYKLLNVAFFALAGAMGIVFLRQGYGHSIDAENKEGRGARRLVFVLWVILYGFVGSQMAWTLAPFMGDPALDFLLFRHPGGSNFYADVLGSLRDLLLP
jgi:hypothetical protein